MIFCQFGCQYWKFDCDGTQRVIFVFVFVFLFLFVFVVVFVLLFVLVFVFVFVLVFVFVFYNDGRFVHYWKSDWLTKLKNGTDQHKL